jgi:hypothetical protein
MASFGFRPATVARHQLDQLDRDGFTVFSGVIGPVWLEQMRAKFDEIHAAEGRYAGSEARPNIPREDFEAPVSALFASKDEDWMGLSGLVCVGHAAWRA